MPILESMQCTNNEWVELDTSTKDQKKLSRFGEEHKEKNDGDALDASIEESASTEKDVVEDSFEDSGTSDTPTDTERDSLSVDADTADSEKPQVVETVSSGGDEDQEKTEGKAKKINSDSQTRIIQPPEKDGSEQADTLTPTPDSISPFPGRDTSNTKLCLSPKFVFGSPGPVRSPADDDAVQEQDSDFNCVEHECDDFDTFDSEWEKIQSPETEAREKRRLDRERQTRLLRVRRKSDGVLPLWLQLFVFVTLILVLGKLHVQRDTDTTERDTQSAVALAASQWLERQESGESSLTHSECRSFLLSASHSQSSSASDGPTYVLPFNATNAEEAMYHFQSSVQSLSYAVTPAFFAVVDLIDDVLLRFPQELDRVGQCVTFPGDATKCDSLRVLATSLLMAVCGGFVGLPGSRGPLHLDRLVAALVGLAYPLVTVDAPLGRVA